MSGAPAVAEVTGAPAAVGRALTAAAADDGEALLLLDAGGRALWANAAFARLTGLDPAAPDFGASDRGLAARLRRVPPEGAELRVADPRGGVRRLRFRRRPAEDGVLLTGRDVTEARRADVRLRAGARRARAEAAGLREALDALDHGFALYDARDRLTACNRKYHEIYAASAAAIHPGARFADILRHGLDLGQYPDAEGRAEAWLEERLAEHAAPHRDLLQQLPGDRWLRVRERRTARGGLAGLRIDVTEAVRAERSLKAILDGAGAGSWEWDLTSGEIETDARWARLLGEAPAERRLRRAADCAARIHPDDLGSVRAALRAHLHGESPFHEAELRVRRADGSWLWVVDRARVSARDRDGRARRLSGVRVDVSARKAAELALGEALRRAEAAHEEKSRFVAAMSHEVRTPLTGVIGYLHLLSGQTDLSAESRRFLDRAMRGGAALQAVVNDVLDVARLEAGELRPAPRPTDAAALLAEAAALFEAPAAAKGLVLRVEGLEGLPPRLLLDPDRLRQIAMNLLGNGVKFTERGEVRLRADWEPATAELRLEVSDTGPGFGPDAAARLFRRFGQLDGPPGAQNGGAGLGLAICKGLAEAMGGGIAAEGRPGVGATFLLRLPAPRVAAPEGSDCAALAGLRVLIADGEGAAPEGLAALVRAGGAVPRRKAGAAAVRAAAAAEPFDVILLTPELPQAVAAALAADLRRGPGPNGSAVILRLTAPGGTGAEMTGDLDGVMAEPKDLSALTEALAAAFRALDEAVGLTVARDAEGRRTG